ncbi:MAG: hypothetical protein ABIR98_07275 [Usitatibacter sp.]
MTYYYRRPEPAAVVDAMLALGKQGALRNPEVAAPFAGFLAGVLSKNRATAAANVHRLAVLPAEDQPVLILGLWYSGHPDTKALLAGLAKEMPAQRAMIEDLARSTPAKLVEVPLDKDPWVLAALWGNFMATGDEAPVLRIIDALPFTMIAQGDKQRLAMGRTAEWSLISNAAQHPRVMEIVRRNAAARTGAIANMLNRVAARAEEVIRQEKAAAKAPGRKP